MRYVIDVDDKTGQATLQIGDDSPLRLLTAKIGIDRPPEVDEIKTSEVGFMFYKPGARGMFTVEAEIDYTLPPR